MSADSYVHPIAHANTVAATGFVRALVDAGVTDAIVSPGSRSTPLVLAFDALATAGRVRMRVVLDERSAGFVALGLARATTRPVALLGTSGSAGANYFPAIVEAALSRLPLIVLTADRPPELRDCGAAQTIDQTHLFGRHVRAFFDLGAPSLDGTSAHLATMAARAVAVASHRGTAGPVHVNCPFREPLWDAESVTYATPLGAFAGAFDRPAVTLHAAPPPQPDATALAAFAARFTHTTRGIIVAGPMLDGREAFASSFAFAAAVQRLGKALGWPVLADPLSNARLPAGPGSPVIARYDAMLRDSATASRLAPDFVVHLGRVPTSKHLATFIASTPRMMVDPAGEWLDPSHTADTLVTADPTAFCTTLAAAVIDTSFTPETAWMADWRTAETTADAALAEIFADTAMGENPADADEVRGDARQVWEGLVARIVAATLPDGAVWQVASSMPIRDADSFVPCLNRRIAVLGNRGANGIDGTLSTALGTALGTPNRPTVLLCGDLAFLHDLSGLVAAGALADERELNLTVVIVDNGGGGIFEFLPIAQHPTAFSRYFLTPHRHVDLAAVASAVAPVRVHAEITTANALRTALTSAISRPGLDVLCVPIDRAFNVAMHRQAFAAVATRLGTVGADAVASGFASSFFAISSTTSTTTAITNDEDTTR